jgi:hypothetical protein
VEGQRSPRRPSTGPHDCSHRPKSGRCHLCFEPYLLCCDTQPENGPITTIVGSKRTPGRTMLHGKTQSRCARCTLVTLLHPHLDEAPSPHIQFSFSHRVVVPNELTVQQSAISHPHEGHSTLLQPHFNLNSSARLIFTHTHLSTLPATSVFEISTLFSLHHERHRLLLRRQSHQRQWCLLH